MSLINDMLRDLDSRNAAADERGGLARNVRALPGAPQARRIHPILLVLCAALMGGGAVWLLLQPPGLQTQAEPAPIAAHIPPAAAPESSAMPAVEEPPPQAKAAPTEVAALRMETEISHPPMGKEAPPPAAAPIAPAMPQAASRSTAAAPARPADAAPPRTNASPQISKQPSDAASTNEQAEGEYRRGVAALKRGDSVEAGEALRAALRFSPYHVAARQALLAQLTEQQRWADAETLALDGVGLLPQHSEWALLAARLMYERGEAASALATLDQYAGGARRNADYQILHALLLARAGRNADAANCYRTALTLRPNEGRWWYGLGRALDADNRETEAKQAYEKARDSGNLPSELQQAVERRLRQS